MYQYIYHFVSLTLTLQNTSKYICLRFQALFSFPVKLGLSPLASALTYSEITSLFPNISKGSAHSKDCNVFTMYLEIFKGIHKDQSI